MGNVGRPKGSKNKHRSLGRQEHLVRVIEIGKERKPCRFKIRIQDVGANTSYSVTLKDYTGRLNGRKVQEKIREAFTK